MEFMKDYEKKAVYTVKEVADILKVNVEAVKDIIDSGDLKAIGKCKDMVKYTELYNFTSGDESLLEIEKRPIDAIGNQRYPHPSSILIENLNDKEWETLKQNGKKELSPYWNESREKWCLALSLGYDENHKRIRKVIQANTQEELWAKYGELKCENMILPEEDTKAIIYPVTCEEPKNLKADMLVKDYIMNYMDSMEGEGSRAFDGKINSSKHVINQLGNLKMCELDADVIRKFINKLPAKIYERGGKTNNYSQSSINKIYDFLHTIIKYALEEEVIKKDFMIRLKRPKSKQYKDKEYVALSNDEFKRISDIVKDNDMLNVWIHVMMYTGVRPSEALALKFSDIDYEKGTIKILRTLSYEQIHDIFNLKRKGNPVPIIKELKNDNKGKGINYQVRELSASSMLLDIIKKWEDSIKSNSELMENKRANGTEEFLFCGSRGQKWLYRDYRQAYNRALRKAGLSIIEFNPYRFRHSFCTSCFRKGLDVKTVQRLMGDNTSEMVLRVYANMDQSDMLRGSKVISEHMDSILQ